MSDLYDECEYDGDSYESPIDKICREIIGLPKSFNTEVPDYLPENEENVEFDGSYWSTMLEGPTGEIFMSGVAEFGRCASGFFGGVMSMAGASYFLESQKENNVAGYSLLTMGVLLMTYSVFRVGRNFYRILFSKDD